VSGTSPDEAREFLDNFLAQLMVVDQTNQELVQAQVELAKIQTAIFHQNQKLIQQKQQEIQALAGVSAQLDGLAQRADYLYEQMGRLGQILVDEEQEPLPPTAPGAPSIGQMAAGAIDQFMYGSQGGGRRRRR
jgi:hypothetical protein